MVHEFGFMLMFGVKRKSWSYSTGNHRASKNWSVLNKEENEILDICKEKRTIYLVD